MSGALTVAERSAPAASKTRNFGITFIVTAVISALSFVTGLLAVRILHPAGRGELATIQLFPAALGTVAMLGLWESVVYFGCRDRARSGTLLATATVFTLCVAPVFIVVGLLLIPKVLAAQSPHVIHYAKLYLALIALYSILLMPTYAARTLGELTTWNALRLLPPAMWVGVLVIAYFRHCADPPVWWRSVFLVSLSLLVPVNWAVFAAVFSGSNYVFEDGVRGLGDTPAVFWAESRGLVVTAVVLATSLRPLGILGAALASIAGYATTTFFLVIRVCNHSSADWHTVVVPNRSDVSILKQWTRKLAGLAERA